MVSQEGCGEPHLKFGPEIIIYCPMLRMHFNDISWGLLSLSQYSHITSPVTPPQKCPGPGSTCVKLPGPRAARSLVTAPVSQSRRILPVSAPVRAPDCQPQSEKSFPAVEPSLARAWRLRVGSYERESELGEEFLSYSRFL